MNELQTGLEKYQPVLDLMGTLTQEQGLLALAIYRGIADRGVVTTGELSSLTKKPAAEIDAYLNEVPGVFRDDDGNIVGFWGLTAAPVSNHQLIRKDKTLYAWCAWDTLFLPALLGNTFTVRSLCAQTDKPIELLVSPTEILKASETDIYLSMLLPDETAFTQDIVGSFCHHIYFFKNKSAALAWAAQKEHIHLISLEDAFELGLQKNAQQFSLNGY